jgi:hypothetical protein
MNKMNWKSTLVFAAALVGATVLLDAQAWAGKPAPPTPTPVNPTSIVYQIQFWDLPSGGSGRTNGTNNWGEAVGYEYLPDDTIDHHAFLYDAPIDPSRDSATAIDLHEAMGSKAPAGWVIASATDINDQGVIVGYLSPDGSDVDIYHRRGYVLDTHLSTNVSLWTIQLLPEIGSSSFPKAINEQGDIAGVYLVLDENLNVHWDAFVIPAAGTPVSLLGQYANESSICMNNAVLDRGAQVAGVLSDGRAFRWTYPWTPPPGQPAPVVILAGVNRPDVAGINDSGTIGGTAYTKVSKGGSTFCPMRYDTTLQILSGVQGFAQSINSAADLLVHYGSGPGYLYHDSWKFLKLDDLIDPADSDAPAWFSRNINGFYLQRLSDRIVTTENGDATTRFGLVSGDIVLADGSFKCFLLTPVPKP